MTGLSVIALGSMKKYFIVLAALLLSGCAVDLSPQGAFQKDRPRIVVTTDPELDDLNSLVRFLLYSTDFQIEGLVYASSQFHWKGDGEGTLWFVEGREYTRFGLDFGPMSSWRWPEGPSHIEQVIEAYKAVYPNLAVHAPGYPSPDYLKSVYRVGNIEFDGDFATDTPGSELIKSLILDDIPGPLYITAWGGQSTIARALFSIQLEYENTPAWAEIRNKVVNKVILLVSGDQDDTEAKYIRPQWPELYPAGVIRGGMALSYGAQSRASSENASYYTPQWMQENISSKGPLGEIYRVWGDGKGMVEDDIFDYFGLSGYTDQELREMGYIVWTPVQEKGSWLGEGDTFTFLNLLNFGLRVRDDVGYGGVGGFRRQPAVDDPVPGFLGDGVSTGQESSGTAYPDFFQVVQNDFATRLNWSVTPRFTDANHEPHVGNVGPLDITAKPGEAVLLSGIASDPDGDQVSMRWWQYQAVDSYDGEVVISRPDSALTTVVVPVDAKPGQTIHMVFEATDNAALPLTRYKRVIITIAGS